MNINMNVDNLVNRLFLWCMFSAISGIPIVILYGIIHYFVYGCWPIGRTLTSNCAALAPLWAMIVPLLLAGIIGFIWSGKTKIRIPAIHQK